jgi:DNA replication licensing factor MCM5
MSGFDADHVFSVSRYDERVAAAPDAPSEIERALREFIMQYRVGGQFIYRRVALSSSYGVSHKYCIPTEMP